MLKDYRYHYNMVSEGSNGAYIHELFARFWLAMTLPHDYGVFNRN